ncbi:Signal peptide, CUB and EGF-like domain-containing protein 3 [Gracilariopsis chorda]|uniref:Signal peptide, CUB and EGF-like domain-containing protein 3 n=1 Tax=Gracilariopsis chorda TaxID=448386 RepID=A0A2V3IMC7_9FLOR|nr:Signal peptide, CUB and EGF-like domain-containing protein 3 [Gracilariopsis chorda]|eukprot:PXF43231.1 Signal peptide, CUB and EGF-like domain-containing protein 3 [Gracilariopsis chorda]
MKKQSSFVSIAQMISVKAAQLLCFLLVLLASASAAEMCGPGHFLDGTTCKECPPGTFQYQSNADSCIPCSAGTFTPGLGAQVANLCIECPENSISSAGSGSCTPCPSESYANRDQTKCVNCPPGQHLEYDDFCVPCRPGFYRPDRSSSSCAVCPKGYDSEEGATACHKIPPCPLGYEVDRNDCQKCFFNYFRGEDMERCEECPLYTVSSRGAAECKGCPAGQFLKGSRCENCPSGSKTVGEGGIVCRIDNALCPVSYFEKSNGDCHTCYPGYRLDLLTNQCTQCAENEFSPGGVVINCELCPTGMIGTGATCNCPPGKRLVNGRCTLCPAGTFRSLNLPIDLCLDCFHPVFSETFDVSTPDRSLCEMCPGNKITTDGISCIVPTPRPPCPDGLIYAGNRNDICISPQTGCLPGLIPKILPNSGGFLEACVKPDGTLPCPPGTVANQLSHCVSCSPGSVVATDPSGRVYCKTCPSNAYSPGGIARTCTTCSKGFRRDKYGTGCSCTARNAPGHYVDSNGRCTKCPVGTYANNKHDEEIRECKSCPAGTFNNQIGQNSCNLCQVNKFSDVRATQCRSCPAGTVSYGLGEASCVPVLGDSCLEFTRVLSCGSLAPRGKCVIQTQQQTCRNGRPTLRIHRDTVSRVCTDVRECAILPTRDD